MVNQDQLKDITQRVVAIEGYLKIPEKRMQLGEEELKTQDPTFWDDPKAAEAQMKNIRGLKVWVAAYDKLKGGLEDLEVLIEFAKEGAAEVSEVDQQHSDLLKKKRSSRTPILIVLFYAEVA